MAMIIAMPSCENDSFICSAVPPVSVFTPAGSWSVATFALTALMTEPVSRSVMRPLTAAYSLASRVRTATGDSVSFTAAILESLMDLPSGVSSLRLRISSACLSGSSAST